MDEANEMTEARLRELEEELKKVYAEAQTDISKRLDAFERWFSAADKRMREKLQAGKLSEKKYKAWRLTQVRQSEQYSAVRDKIAVRMTRANEIAAAYVNDATPGIYTLNRNYSAYQIEQAENVDFALLDERTVRRLAMYDPDLVPNYPVERAVDRGIDLDYSKRQINSVVQSGILTGKTIPDIAADLRSRIESLNHTSAVRLARTACTAAQNGGRLDGLLAAEELGLSPKKEWMAALDDRTRHSHALLDGVAIGTDETFSNGCRYPGDPRGAPEEVYNCRCTLVASFGGESGGYRRAQNSEPGKTRAKNEVIPDMTFAKWLEWKEERIRRAK